MTGWLRSRAEIEADELQREAVARDSQPIASCQAGQVVVVSGTVRSLSLRPKASLPAFEIEVYDGTGSLKVIWIGRHRIPGVDVGRRITVCGRLSCFTGGPTIFNA